MLNNKSLNFSKRLMKNYCTVLTHLSKTIRNLCPLTCLHSSPQNFDRSMYNYFNEWDGRHKGNLRILCRFFFLYVRK